MLTPNKQSLLNYLMQFDSPIELSARKIAEEVYFYKVVREYTEEKPQNNVAIRTMHSRIEKFHPTFQSVQIALKGLQKDGYIALDYSVRVKPRIIVNRLTRKKYAQQNPSRTKSPERAVQ
jgi:hypothetical protein